ncbi:hypothetical protein [Parvularcula sp. IMCC14364]|uniref:hypothetical protein n=1 Tax=Parvularcula sp. IMCC14364 TaxID=3067902 RepID=UPI00274137FD|nr:hypothetical protein [Parvularcula sp. IMCC14364]
MALNDHDIFDLDQYEKWLQNYIDLFLFLFYVFFTGSGSLTLWYAYSLRPWNELATTDFKHWPENETGRATLRPFCFWQIQCAGRFPAPVTG